MAPTSTSAEIADGGALGNGAREGKGTTRSVKDLGSELLAAVLGLEDDK